MIPSTKVVPMSLPKSLLKSLLKYKTKEVNRSSRLKKLLQKSTLVLLMFMAAGCSTRDPETYCTDMRVIKVPQVQCVYVSPTTTICSKKEVFRPVCANWA